MPTSSKAELPSTEEGNRPQDGRNRTATSSNGAHTPHFGNAVLKNCLPQPPRTFARKSRQRPLTSLGCTAVGGVRKKDSYLKAQLSSFAAPPRIAGVYLGVW